MTYVTLNTDPNTDALTRAFIEAKCQLHNPASSTTDRETVSIMLIHLLNNMNDTLNNLTAPETLFDFNKLVEFLRKMTWAFEEVNVSDSLTECCREANTVVKEYINTLTDRSNHADFLFRLFVGDIIASLEVCIVCLSSI